MKIAAILAEGFEETEFIAVADLLRRAKLDVVVISSTFSCQIESSHGFYLIADKGWNEVNFDDFDCIFLPGGKTGVANLRQNRNVIEIVSRFAANGKIICAICAAPLVLADAGILEEKRFTCYPSTRKEILVGNFCDSPVVIDGNIITGRGMGAVFDFGLSMVEIFCGKENAELLKKAVVYGI